MRYRAFARGFREGAAVGICAGLVLFALVVLLWGCTASTPPPTPAITVAARALLPIAIVDRRPGRPGKAPEIAAYPGPTPTATEGAGYP